MEFSTFDADNDGWQGFNCAVYRGSGFWLDDCGWQNVNGYYSESNYDKWRKMWWDDHNNLKKTRLMIRPAS